MSGPGPKELLARVRGALDAYEGYLLWDRDRSGVARSDRRLVEARRNLAALEVLIEQLQRERDEWKERCVLSGAEDMARAEAAEAALRQEES